MGGSDLTKDIGGAVAGIVGWIRARRAVRGGVAPGDLNRVGAVRCIICPDAPPCAPSFASVPEDVADLLAARSA
jgi:hypothetical protein